MEKPLRTLLQAVIILVTLSYAGISYLQYQDTKTFDTAKEMDYYITGYCKMHQQLPG